MIRIERLRKAWPGFSLEIERLEISAGEYFVVLGPSGAGKTVLLLSLAGLLRPDDGRVWFGQRDVTDMPPERRGVGWVSQSNTLFPHLTAAGNIRFGQPYSRSSAGEFEKRAARLIELLELDALLDRWPADLSGGEAQRVMLARALVVEPRVLLLDEPLRGLDPTTAERLRDELAQIHRELGTTTFHITHDHVEARALADRIAVLRDGRIEQIGPADEVFERPATCFVARFTGAENVFALSGRGGQGVENGAATLDPALLPPCLPADATHIAVRPEHVEILTDDQAAASTGSPPNALQLRGTIESLAQHGGWLRVTVRCGPTRWIVFVHPRTASRPVLSVGSTTAIAVAPDYICPLRD